MSDNTQRRDLKAEFKDTRPDAGVYRILNSVDGSSIVGSTSNLKSIQNRIEFARSTDSLGALDPKTKAAVQAHGFEALVFEVLEHLDFAAEATPSAIRSDLTTLEQLWCEKLSAEAI